MSCGTLSARPATCMDTKAIRQSAFLTLRRAIYERFLPDRRKGKTIRCCGPENPLQGEVPMATRDRYEAIVEGLQKCKPAIGSTGGTRSLCPGKCRLLGDRRARIVVLPNT